MSARRRRPAPERLSERGLLIAAGLAALLLLGLGVDAGLLAVNYRLGQAALETAAQAAATAVEPEITDGLTTWRLRLEDTPDQPSAYVTAEQALGAARGRVTLTDVVSDGSRVLVRGNVAAPTFVGRLLGVSEVTFSLVATADLQPPGQAPR
jgi:hypothetical protein